MQKCPTIVDELTHKIKVLSDSLEQAQKQIKELEGKKDDKKS